MSNRERWIVYPLLFLALGLAMRTGIVQQEGTEEVISGIVKCKALYVVGKNDKPVVVIKADENSGAGLVATSRYDGVPQTVLTSNPAGGQLALLDRNENIILDVGQKNGSLGLFVTNAKTGQEMHWLTLAVQAQKVEPTPPKTPAKPDEQPAEKAAPDAAAPGSPATPDAKDGKGKAAS